MNKSNRERVRRRIASLVVVESVLCLVLTGCNTTRVDSAINGFAYKFNILGYRDDLDRADNQPTSSPSEPYYSPSSPAEPPQVTQQPQPATPVYDGTRDSIEMMRLINENLDRQQPNKK